jgi:DNA-binding NarL/FixJ family response regulator
VVKILLADNAEVMRHAIRTLLSECKDIKILGEAGTLQEVIQKAKELKPDVIVLDLYMSDGIVVSLSNTTKLLAISFANDAEAKELASTIGATRLLDKMSLAQSLIPAILELAPLETN